MATHVYFEDDKDSTESLLRTSHSSNEEYDEESLTEESKSTKKGINWVGIGFVAVLGFAVILWIGSMVELFTGLAAVHEEAAEMETKSTIGFDDIFNASFSVKRTSLVWVENDPRDGIFTYRDPDSNDILLESIENGVAQVFVKEKDLKVKEGVISVDSFALSHDAEYLLLRTNSTKQWRHSFHCNIYIYRLSDKKMFPLTSSSTVNDTPKIVYAAWSPTGHKMAYVMENDLYITDLVNHKRITFDGSATVFNGVPDWVYEEEVFASDFALWWSPDSTHLAYLRLDETDVPEYNLQLYIGSNTSYPRHTDIRYPKAGAPNPLVSLHIHSLLTNDTIMVTSNATSPKSLVHANTFHDFDQEDRLITDVVWATTSHTHLLFKQMNRVQDHRLTNMVSIQTKDLQHSTVSMIQEYKPTDGGWIDVDQSMVYLPSEKGVQYLDNMDTEEGYAHLGVVTVSEDHKTKVDWLTSGPWEVVSGTVNVDEERKLIHYISTERSHLERHLYSISYKDMTHPSKQCITCPEDPEEHAYYSASFSPKSGYYILNYEGPDVPTTVVKKVDDPEFNSVLQDNQELKDLLGDYLLPTYRMTTITTEGGVEMSAQEALPPTFEASKKYPVLFHVYGGPSSQLATYRFELDWQTFIASQMGFIVVTVDGRGTGFKGRKYRVGVRGNLGELETIDQVNAGKHWASLDYVDESRIAIWGWSYGGYMTTKVIEANSGVFVAGLAVAPVTDWHFYDSVYTERYMLTPEMNPDGYETSAVNNMTGFKNAKYLLAHGTGDDNVHFQHSAVLVDKLTLEDIHNYRVQFFPDSNHRINFHNANKNVYYLLTEFLLDSYGGHEYQHIYRESNGRFSGPLPDEH
ncbi:hypothetical protein K501DRAFT_328149 [Backusella circina FSU 941]|nr:hypothetical protein K501DRAFT_328149 [Backusella circina FSU 941]